MEPWQELSFHFINGRLLQLFQAYYYSISVVLATKNNEKVPVCGKGLQTSFQKKLCKSDNKYAKAIFQPLICKTNPYWSILLVKPKNL